MSEPNNGEALSTVRRLMPSVTTEKHCPLPVRQRIVNALAKGDSKRSIARALRVSNNTVTAIAEQEWQQVETRKQRIVSQCERNATLRDAPIATGVAVDKVLALTNQTPIVAVHVNIPTPEEQAEREARHPRLDEFTRRMGCA